MFLADPPPTQGDLHFRVLGFPVRVHPFFWVVALFMGMTGGDAEPVNVLTWVAVVFVSILIHELGHALAIRFYGGYARIVLYGFGGLAIEDRANRTAWRQIAISFAGPLAGFLFAAIIASVVRLAGGKAAFAFAGGELSDNVFAIDMLFLTFYFEPFQSMRVNILIYYLMFVNVFWGLVNLLPIYPLDGGQISRELFTLNNPWQGIQRSLWVSVIAAAGVAIYAVIGFKPPSFFMAVFFGFMAYSSWQTLQGFTGRGPGAGW